MAFALVETANTLTGIFSPNAMARAGGTPANMSTTIVSTGTTASRWFTFNPRGTNSSAATVEPTTATINGGWVCTDNVSSTTLSDYTAVAGTSWTIAGTWNLSATNTGAFKIGVRYQTATKAFTSGIPVSGTGISANGWFYSAIITPGVATSGSWSITTAGIASSVSTSNKYLWIELVLNVTTAGALSTNVTMSGTTFTPGKFTYTGSVSETLTNSESLARQFVGTRGTSDTLTTSDSPSRVYAFPRSASDTLTLSETLTRQFVGTRPTTDTLSPSDAAGRGTSSFTRAVSESVPTTDTASKVANYVRGVVDPIGAVADFQGTHPNVLHVAGVVRDQANNPVAGVTVKLFRQADDFLVATTTSDGSGNYSFGRDQFDPYVYYVLAYVTSTPQKHGVTDRGLVPA